MTKLEMILAGVVLALLMFIGWSFWERHEGALKCENADKAATAAQEAHNAAILVNQQQSIAQEKKAYEDALLQPVSAPVVRLCVSPPALPQAAPAPRRDSAGPPLPAAVAVDSVPGPDIGRSIVQVGHDADAEIAALEAYIRDVCVK